MRDASPGPGGDAASLTPARDAPSSGAGRGACGMCARELPARWPGWYCSKRCRQAAFRLRKRRETFALEPEQAERGRFAYADPPYLGRCVLYAHFHPDGRCWDDVETHAVLIGGLEARRVAGELAGYAVSCATDSLQALLPFVPREHRIATWAKPGAASARTFGIHNMQEQVIVVGGRRARPAVRDWLMAHPARGGGDLIGRKPIAFCAWIFDLLGMVPGDELEDMFTGTGVVGRAWRALSSVPAKPEPGRRASFLEASREVHDDADAAAFSLPGSDAGSLAAASDARRSSSDDAMGVPPC